MWVELWVGVFGAIPSNLLKRMAGTTGLEPAASAVTGQRSNQLNYVPTFVVCESFQTAYCRPIWHRCTNLLLTGVSSGVSSFH
jgi:hypothetical protein